MDLTNHRQEYNLGSIDIDTTDPCPFKQFEAWFQNAVDGQALEPNALTLSTVDSDGRPSARTVLLKYFDESGFVFFTSYLSRKAKHIEKNPEVSLLFPWLSLQRQVEISGTAEKVSKTESMKYFALRPHGSQLGAWVSQQSSVVSARTVLLNKLAELKRKFGSGQIPMPPSWGGYRVNPQRFEFWQGGPNRLHDRIEYTIDAERKVWQRRRLAP